MGAAAAGRLTPGRPRLFAEDGACQVAGLRAEGALGSAGAFHRPLLSAGRSLPVNKTCTGDPMITITDLEPAAPRPGAFLFEGRN